MHNARENVKLKNHQYSPENLSSGRRIMLKLIKVALNLKLPLCYDLKKSGNFKFRATFMSLSFVLRPELRFSGLYLLAIKSF